MPGVQKRQKLLYNNFSSTVYFLLYLFCKNKKVKTVRNILRLQKANSPNLHINNCL